MNRQIVLMRINSDQVPPPDNATHLTLPDGINELLDQGFTVISHNLSVPDLSGDMILSLYVEAD